MFVIFVIYSNYLGTRKFLSKIGAPKQLQFIIALKIYFPMVKRLALLVYSRENTVFRIFPLDTYKVIPKIV